MIVLVLKEEIEQYRQPHRQLAKEATEGGIELP
jgi:hypothetical protein